MRNLLWDLFVHTGKIEYYLKYNEEIEYEKRNKSK